MSKTGSSLSYSSLYAGFASPGLFPAGVIRSCPAGRQNQRKPLVPCSDSSPFSTDFVISFMPWLGDSSALKTC